jgi:hypothetical protein
MKRIGLILCLAVAGCGVGSDPTPKTMAVRLDAGTVLPSPFVMRQGGTEVATSAPLVTFASGPVDGPLAIVSPQIVSSTPIIPTPNWCTDGFVVGPCTLRCTPGEFVVGPCP